MNASKTRDAYDRIAERFQLLAHPARLQILDELRRGEACVCHLQVVLDRPQAYVSQQLRTLREAGVVEDERDGLNVFYRVVDPQILELLGGSLGPPQEKRGLPACNCPKCEA